MVQVPGEGGEEREGGREGGRERKEGSICGLWYGKRGANKQRLEHSSFYGNKEERVEGRKGGREGGREGGRAWHICRRTRPTSPRSSRP